MCFSSESILHTTIYKAFLMHLIFTVIFLCTMFLTVITAMKDCHFGESMHAQMMVDRKKSFSVFSVTVSGNLRPKACKFFRHLD